VAKDSTEVTVIALKKKPQATKCGKYRTVNLIVHTSKIIERYSEKGLKRKLRIYSENIIVNLEEEEELGMQLGF